MFNRLGMWFAVLLATIGVLIIGAVAGYYVGVVDFLNKAYVVSLDGEGAHVTFGDKEYYMDLLELGT